jgi:ABC-type transport system involved in cytochrome c biogenesis permease subunit
VEIFLENPAIAASLGFCIIWICYLRVSLLGKCTHSHGWIRFVGSLFV